MHFETHTIGAAERRLRWAIWGAVGAALILGAADLATAQDRPRRDIRDIRPQEVSVSFDRLIPKEVERDDTYQVVIDYELERETWRRLERRNMDIWMELRVSREVAIRFNPYNLFTFVVPIEERTGQLRVPDWVPVDVNDPVRLCPLVAYPDENPRAGTGYFCQSMRTKWIRSDWSVEIDTGQSFRLRHQEEALPMIHWHLIWLERG